MCQHVLALLNILRRYKMKKLIVATLMFTSSLVSAEEPFKVAIIKDAIGSAEIVSGAYDEGMNLLTTSEATPNSIFERAMGLCVANLKLRALNAADTACTDAINSSDSIGASSSKREELKALAYNNRGIVKVMKDEKLSAFDDFTSAILLDESSLVKANLATLKAKSAG